MVGCKGYGQGTGSNSKASCCRCLQLDPWRISWNAGAQCAWELMLWEKSYQPTMEGSQWKNTPTLCPSSGTTSAIRAYLGSSCPQLKPVHQLTLYFLPSISCLISSLKVRFQSCINPPGIGQQELHCQY